MPVRTVEIAESTKEVRNERTATETTNARTLPRIGKPAHYTSWPNHHSAGIDGRTPGMDAYHTGISLCRAGARAITCLCTL